MELRPNGSTVARWRSCEDHGTADATGAPRGWTVSIQWFDVDGKRVPLIGIAGGIASGKSLIAEMFADAGAAVISADALAHEVLEYDVVKRAARERWGDEIFAADGRVDRAGLARIVFAPPPAGPPEREYLEQLIHPEVGRLSKQRVGHLAHQGTAAAIVLDVPLLFESGWDRQCDRIVYVEAPREQRLARAMARGWSQQDFEGREAVQESLATKRQRADLVIDNSGSPDHARAQVEKILRQLVEEFRPDEHPYPPQ